MRNRLIPAAFACLLAICGTAGAKTVALWRASRGVLDATDLLYRPQSMTMIIFR